MGTAAGSTRGLVVEFSASIIDQIDTTYGVVVGEPRYLRQRRYVNVVPVYGSGFVPQEGDRNSSDMRRRACEFVSI